MAYRDRVQPYKDETVVGGGSATDTEPFPTTINPVQDGMEAAGLVLNDWNGGSPIQDTNVSVTRTGNDLILADVTNGSLALSGLTREYDFLLDNDPPRVGNTLTLTRTGGLVTKLTWNNTGTGKNIKTLDFTRVSGQVSTLVVKVFLPADGTTVVAQVTDTITRTSGKVSSITRTRDVS